MKKIMVAVMILVAMFAMTAVSWAACEKVVVYQPKGDSMFGPSGEYTINLKAGEETAFCITVESGTNMKCEVSSNDFNYFIVFEDETFIKAGPDAVWPDGYGCMFKLKAGDTDQKIKLKIKWPFED